MVTEKTKFDLLNKKDKIIFSGDMQKALFFPILENKFNFFMRKFVTYNMTFCEYGENAIVYCLSHGAEMNKVQMRYLIFI